jgi:trans-aconitate methyltransferase
LSEEFEHDTSGHTKKVVALFDKYAVQYQEKYMDLSLFHDSFDFFCASVENKNATILELACGPGNITKYISEKRPDFKIHGTDLSPKMLELAAQNVPNATFELMDGRDLLRVTKKYDAIMVGFCLPYLSKEDCWKLIKSAEQILNENGILYLSTMEDEYSKSRLIGPSDGDSDGIYTYFHEADYLRDFLEQTKFTLLDISRIDTEQDGGNVRDLVLIAQK